MTDLPRTHLKDLLLLHRTRERRSRGLALVPGFKCLEELLVSPWPVESLLLTDQARDQLPRSLESRLDPRTPVWRIHDSDAARLADQPSPEGVIALARVPERLDSVTHLLEAGGPRLVLDGLADPGNLGSVIRTAAWFGITRVLLLGNCADLCSLKVLRASMGAVFRLDCAARDESPGLEPWRDGRRWIGLDARAGDSLERFRFAPGDVLVMGSESHGLGASQARLDLSLAIPGGGALESLNVGHAFAAVAWEQFRQSLDD